MDKPWLLLMLYFWLRDGGLSSHQSRDSLECHTAFIVSFLKAQVIFFPPKEKQSYGILEMLGVLGFFYVDVLHVLLCCLVYKEHVS